MFRRDADGDFWLLGNRPLLIRTERGVVFPESVTDAVGRINAVDLAATYSVEGADGVVAVTAITLRDGMAVTTADLTDAFASMPVGLAPDVVHVVPEMPLSATFRPTVSALRADGIPKASRNAWHLEPDTGKYKRLTAAARAQLCGTDDSSGAEN